VWTCGKTFCSNTGTPYHRLQHRRATFDEVAALSVEGLNKSAIARVKRIAWNTVHRWLEKAADLCRRFNDLKTTGFTVTELQADEIRSIVGGKQQPIWIFAAIEIGSRLWPSTVVGTRSYRNTLQLFRDISSRTSLECVPLIATDGFAFYANVIRRVFGPACLPGHQDTQERSHSQGRAKSTDWCCLAIGEGAPLFRGFLETEHLLYRTIESHDPTGLGISIPADDLSSAMEGSIRREYLDHIIVMNVSSLRRTLKSFFDYYHDSRCHLALNKDSPETGEVQPPDKGIVVEIPRVGGLHHRYERRAA